MKRAKANTIEDQYNAVTFSIEQAVGPFPYWCESDDGKARWLDTTLQAVYADAVRLAHMGREAQGAAYIARRLELTRLVGQMTREQGLSDCDMCGGIARFEWVRTPQDQKAMRRKVRGSWINVLPVAHRCSNHVPYFAPEWAERYRDVTAKSSQVAA